MGSSARGGWITPLFDNQAGTFLNETYERADAFLFGRRTYEIFAGSWGLTDPDANPIAKALNTKPKDVASTTLTDPQWKDTTVLSTDLAARVGELKAEPGGELQVHGSGALIRWLHDNDLVDEINLWICPVVVGQGGRAVPRQRPGHCARAGGVTGHPRRSDHPDLPSHRASPVRNGHRHQPPPWSATTDVKHVER